MSEEFRQLFLSMLREKGLSIHPRFQVECLDDFEDEWAVVRVFPAQYDQEDCWFISATIPLSGGDWQFTVDPSGRWWDRKRFCTIEEVAEFFSKEVDDLNPFASGSDIVMYQSGSRVVKLSLTKGGVELAVCLDGTTGQETLDPYRAEELAKYLTHYAKLAREMS